MSNSAHGVSPLKRAKAPERTLPSNQVYWTRFALGVVAGLVCGIVRLGVEGMAIGAAFYAASFLIALTAFHVPLDPEGQKRQYYTVGLGTYLAVWFTVWVLLNTFRVY